MIYITDNYDLLKWTGVTENNLSMTNLSKEELHILIQDNNHEFISLVCESNVAETLTSYIKISIKVNKCIKAFLSPNDIIIYINYVSEKINITKIELQTDWVVDFYSKDRELIKQIELGNMNYSEAIKEACIRGLEVNYDVYDLYYTI